MNILLIGNFFNESHSMRVYAKFMLDELRRFPIAVDLFEPQKKTNKVFKLYFKYVLYPVLITWRLRRKGIVHILDQSYAYLIRYIKLVNQRVRVVVTCHDIIAYYNKKDIYDRSLFGYVSNLLWRWSVNSLGQADRVLAVSNYTKSKIVEHLKIVSSKIEVIYLGYNEFRSQRQPNNDIIERFRQIAHKRKLLSVGTTESRKNLDCLIRLLSLLNTTHNQYVLVRVGEMLNPTQIEMLIENGQQKNLIQLGNLEDEDLKFVYEHCDVFTYPSLEEGFGLPCLEAMSLGIPVIASVHASIPEIVGGSGLLVDPANIPRMALEVESMIEDSNRRIVLVQAGHERVKQFKWDTVARLVMEIYKEQLSCVE